MPSNVSFLVRQQAKPPIEEAAVGTASGLAYEGDCKRQLGTSIALGSTRYPTTAGLEGTTCLPQGASRSSRASSAGHQSWHSAADAGGAGRTQPSLAGPALTGPASLRTSRRQEESATIATRLWGVLGSEPERRGQGNLEAACAALERAFEHEALEPWLDVQQGVGGQAKALAPEDDVPEWMKTPEDYGGEHLPSEGDEGTLPLFPYVKGDIHPARAEMNAGARSAAAVDCATLPLFPYAQRGFR